MKLSSIVIGLTSIAAVASAAKDEASTVTVTATGKSTHKDGRFDKTKPATSPSSSGTHKDGRFDKTKPATSPSSSGTHKDGRFDKTKNPVTTTVWVNPSGEAKNAFYNKAAANGTAGNGTAVNGTGSGSSNSTGGVSSIENGAIMNGMNFGIAGAVVAGMLLVV